MLAAVVDAMVAVVGIEIRPDLVDTECMEIKPDLVATGRMEIRPDLIEVVVGSIGWCGTLGSLTLDPLIRISSSFTIGGLSIIECDHKDSV